MEYNKDGKRGLIWLKYNAKIVDGKEIWMIW